MIPMRTSTIFKSRWMALVWAAGIICLALDVAGPGDTAADAPQSNTISGAGSDPASDEDVETAARALGLD